MFFSENSNWLTANDPCAILLGSGWRLPTFTEWTNVVSSEGWTNGSGPWNSVLKMHAAGYLYFSNGSLLSSGSSGYYKSSTQGDNTFGWSLAFGPSGLYVGAYNKADGMSARCLRD